MVHNKLFSGTCFLYETNFSGDDIRNIGSIGSAIDCQTECQKEIKCSHFTYDTKSKKCYLKHGDGRVISDSASAKYVSGPRQCKMPL